MRTDHGPLSPLSFLDRTARVYPDGMGADWLAVAGLGLNHSAAQLLIVDEEFVNRFDGGLPDLVPACARGAPGVFEAREGPQDGATRAHVRRPRAEGAMT